MNVSLFFLLSNSFKQGIFFRWRPFIALLLRARLAWLGSLRGTLGVFFMADSLLFCRLLRLPFWLLRSWFFWYVHGWRWLLKTINCFSKNHFTGFCLQHANNTHTHTLA